MKLRVAHPFTALRIALTSGELTRPNSKLTWKNLFPSIPNCTTKWQSTRCWELHRRRSEGFGSVHSQASHINYTQPTITAAFRMKYSWNPAAEAVANHQETRSENRVQPPAEVGDPTVRVEKDQWSATLESLNPEDQWLWRMTKRVMRVVLHLPPGHPSGIALWESRIPCRKSGGSNSAGDRFFGPGSCWDGSLGVEILLPKPRRRTPFNHPWRGLRRQRGFKVQQGSGSERYTE